MNYYKNIYQIGGSFYSSGRAIRLLFFGEYDEKPYHFDNQATFRLIKY